MSDKIRLEDKYFSPFIRQEDILSAIKRMAKEIEKDLADKNPLFICILNGGFMFAAELMAELDDAYEICFAQYASYRGTESTGLLQEIMPPQISVKHRTVVILEDLIDSGLTLSHISDSYKRRGASEVKIAVLLHKPEAPKVIDIQPDYMGLSIDPAFIVGHGLDYNGKGRCYKDIYKILEEEL